MLKLLRPSLCQPQIRRRYSSAIEGAEDQSRRYRSANEDAQDQNRQYRNAIEDAQVQRLDCWYSATAKGTADRDNIKGGLICDGFGMGWM